MAYAGELSLTAWLDPALKYFAEQAGIPLEDYASTVGGIGEGFGLNIITDIFTKGWLSRLIKLTSGLIGTSYAVFGKDVPVRLRKDLLALGTTMALSGLATDPLKLKEDAESLADFIKSLQAGDVSRALATGLRTPGEISARLGMAAPAPAPAPAPTPAPSAGFTSKPSTPSSKSKYTVT